MTLPAFDAIAGPGEVAAGGRVSIESDWGEVASLAIPQWRGLHDSLVVYERDPAAVDNGARAAHV